MNLIHTSPVEINKINEFGTFGTFLCFSDSEYVMTAAGEHIAYSIEIDEADIIDAESLFYHEDANKLDAIVELVMAAVGCDEDTAEELISQREDVHSIECDIEPEDLADVSFEIQRRSAEAARALGFRGVAMDDEQGRMYLIDMEGKEIELVAQ